MLTGQYQHSIDAKGRLFIPSRLREELGETFYVAMGADPCLSVYSEASWARFTEKFESLPYSRAKAVRPIFANAAKCEPDAQGRILLPQKLRAYAQLEKDVTVIGVAAEPREYRRRNGRAGILTWKRTTDISRCCCKSALTRLPSGPTAFMWTARSAAPGIHWRSSAA